ncbi:Uncharacterised protein [Legionella quateirensis]|uniref:Uncharacterized protein n=1 Tax=Legionella quateirensis TaxID=45072 RepID=A0A378KWI2_9GAMM|nr:hypothetical protein Lqua_2575 [Legionella quateirensis]STY18746.1 Uncharacterised protein [Legionella quateirensis]
MNQMSKNLMVLVQILILVLSICSSYGIIITDFCPCNFKSYPHLVEIIVTQLMFLGSVL